MPDQEEELYPEIRRWLNNYLKEKYGKDNWTVLVSEDSHKHFIEDALKRMGINRGLFTRLKIKVDIVASLKKGNREELVHMEVKVPPTSLKDLGQLWGYTQLINPLESSLSITWYSSSRVPVPFGDIRNDSNGLIN